MSCYWYGSSTSVLSCLLSTLFISFVCSYQMFLKVKVRVQVTTNIYTIIVNIYLLLFHVFTLEPLEIKYTEDKNDYSEHNIMLAHFNL